MDYFYKDDDALTDAVSSLAIIASSIGELIGPTYSGITSDLIGIEGCCNLIAIASFFYAIIYFFGTNLFKDLIFPHKQPLEELLIAS